MSDELPAVRAGYDRWSAVYDRDLNPLQGLEGPLVRWLAGEVRGLRVLDLGCGTGRHALWLADNGATVTGVDFSAGMLAEARRKPGAEAVRWLECDLTTPLPFAAEFDLVVSGLVLEHVVDLGGFFRQIRDVLRPGGRAVVSGMHPAMVLKGAEARFTDLDTGEVVSPGTLAHSVGAFVMAAIRAGFHLTEVVERAPDADFASSYPRAERYVGWPMAVVLAMTTEKRQGG